MKKIYYLIKLCRPHQWYKNLLVFLAIIFSNNLFNLQYFVTCIKGLVILIIISSSNYVLNDMIDAKKDRLNPEKKNRAIASRKISKRFAISFFFILLITALIGAAKLNIYFFYIVCTLFIISTAYTFYFKNLIFVDLIFISINFVLRAISGAVIINVFISPWLVIGVFFFALFLGAGKRYGEMKFLNKYAGNHRKVLNYYSKKLFYPLFNILIGLLILVFILYSFFSEHKPLIWTTPLFVYLILRYSHLIHSNNEIARHPEKAIKDIPLLILGLLFIIISLFLIMW